MKIVSIPITKSTKNRLERFGNMNSTFDSVISELLDHVDVCEKYWNGKE